MAAEQRILKQDGYLNIGSGIGTESRNITYHPNLNVILAFDSQNQVKILDVHSGVILQNYNLNSNESEINVCGRYMPLQEKVLFWDGRNIGFRGDYNSVLLLDTVLQPPILQNDDLIKLELLLSEAIIFQTSLKELEQEGLECPNDVSNELLERIKNAQANAKKGIKAQRWNTICLEVSYSSLKLVANNVVVMLKRLERHIPALAIASAINERLTDLLAGSRILDISWHGGNFQRVLMYSEAVRRQTFEKWPHMDYKWALPDQMAQAGFYHQPSSSGEDRAMCFTCSVCLVCWEKTDEPWSEHERHSPTCPFVKGEYTQNVPLSVTYATNPAVVAQPPSGFDVISNSDFANVLCTSCTQTGEIAIYSIERHLKQMHTFNIATLMNEICDDCYESVRVTAICVLPNSRAQSKISATLGHTTPQLISGGGTTAQCTSTSTLRAGVVDSKIVLGLRIHHSTGEYEMRMVVLNIVESDRMLDALGGGSGINNEAPAETTGSHGGGGSGDVGNNNQCDDKFDHRSSEQEQHKSSSSFFEKYADSFDSNGFMSDLVAINTNNSGGVTGSGDKSDAAAALNDLLLEGELIKIDPVCDLSDLTQFLDKSQDGSVMGSYFKEKLIAASQESSNILQNHTNNNNSGSSTTTIPKPVSEEIDCAVVSCTSVKRMNAMSAEQQEGRQEAEEVTEIAEIVPTNGSCNQLLVKLIKRRVIHDKESQIIEATVEDLEDEQMEVNLEFNAESAAAQILLYDCNSFVISNDYSAAVTFNRSKCPRQLCLLPSYNLNERRTQTDSGALCVVCADGTLELYALDDLRSITTVAVENEHFVSVVYCKSLDRVCGCTQNGSLIFYSLNDTDNESGDEMIEFDEDCNNTIVPLPTTSLLEQQDTTLEVTETDGSISNASRSLSCAAETTSTASLSAAAASMPTIRVDLGVPVGAQSSPSPSSTSSVANLLAYKSTDLTIDDLQTFYALTQFDEMLTPYTAEVPSCWNELVQAQKQRKQPQHLRPGDDTHLTKTWRLHNDATTWDEHIIELNLAKAVTLGHIDMKFTLYQQCSNPAAIQVTLLKQNTSGFGYRMKGPHSVNMAFKQASVDDNIDFSLNNSDGCNENPVLTEEYLQTHNAEILAGPIELSSCMDLCDQGGTITLTSPKLFKTRTRNFLLHIKTMSDPSKEGQGKTRVPVRKQGVMRLLISSFANSSSHKFINNTSSSTSSFPQNSTSKQARNDFYIGCDWLHEISITVRGVKTQNRIPNERMQRIAMLESNVVLDNLFKIVSSDCSTTLAKNLALDILNWICTIRLNRLRSPKSERFKQQQQKTNPEKNSTAAAASTDLVAQQAECIAITEKYLQDMILNCIIRSNRSMAHKCVKLVLILTDGVCNLPSDMQTKSTLDVTIKNAVANTLTELPKSNYSSVVRWFTMLACSTSTPDSQNGISEICIKLLTDVAKEIDNRWDPYCSLLGTRFGLYGFPFEPEIYDFDLPNLNKSSVAASTNTLAYIIRSHAGLLQSSSMDFKKLSSIDGVEFRAFPHLIKSKGVSNQLRGLLEVEQLHFTCAATSEATRIDNMDSVSSSSASNINMEELIVPPMQSNSVDVQKEQESDKINDIFNNVKNIIVDKQMKIGNSKQMENDITSELTPNGFGPTLDSSTPMLANNDDKLDMQFKYNNKKALPKFKAICQYIENCDENGSNASNNTTDGNQSDAENKLSSKVQRYLSEQQQQNQQDDSASNMNGTSGNVFPWHKILAPPPKQMVVIDRMHSGARRFVVLDFGSPILLTDLVIPACDELASLHIDIWCFEEEADSVRLVVSQDIGTKTLVLSDIQPPPICRYMKITIIGRYGMSSTKCKIPIGSFYGHSVVLESDGYGDPWLRYMKHPPNNIQTQITALNSLYEDVHCRYSLASCKLMEMLAPILNCDISNVAHMQAFINKQREEENNVVDNSKIVTTYEECIMLQHQINVTRNVIYRLESTHTKPKASSNILQLASRDKLRVLSQNLVEILLHFSIEYGIKNILPLHSHFTIDVANMLFNTLVVYGDAHIQLATCSLLVRMCCFQNWWGDFLADIFCNLFSSQNCKIFPQDRIFFLLTYLGRRSIAMGTCRSIVIDAVLKTLAKLLAPISPRYQEASENINNMCRNEISGLWSKSDLQLITWLLLFLSVCLDDNAERKDKSSNRWEFMSCETDFTKTRSQSNSSSGKQLRCFKKRIIQQNKYSVQPYTDWGKKIFMIQNEHPGIFMELTGKPKSSKSGKSNTHPKVPKESVQEPENNFDKGLKAIRFNNILIVIRGLIALLLEMDFTCNMDLFLLTCKVIARLVSACRPAVQLSKIMTINQLEQLIRLAVWNDQQQPWAVHAITCLLQDLLDADKHYKDNDMPLSSDGLIRPMEGERTVSFFDYSSKFEALYMSHKLGSISAASNDVQYNDGVKYSYLPSLIECEDTEFDEILNDIDIMDRSKSITKKDSLTQNKNNFNFFCKSISSAMDARLDFGIDTNVEIHMRRLTMISSLDMYASLPQILTNEFISTPPETTLWPEYLTDIWSGPEYNCGRNTYEMFKNVFDCIFADLHLQDTWVHLEQVLQMWMTLNSELAEKPYNTGLSQSDVPKIPFGANAVQGLLLALAWHNDIKLRTWCLGFQCLFLSCNSQTNTYEMNEQNDDNELNKINDIIINDENFEKMLLRFFSGYGMSSTIITNRCAGPTICKHLHELLLWLHKKGESNENSTTKKRKLKDTLLNVILQLVQPGGAISNQQGPIDAQSQLVRDLLFIPYDKADLNVSLSIIESVSFLVYNNISNGDKIQCQRSSDANNSTNTFSSLFANVLGSENAKQNTSISDSSLIISLLKLSSSLIQTELPRQPNDHINAEKEIFEQSQTDETKAEQLNLEANKMKTPYIADTVLRHFPTMKRLLGSLSHCTSISFTLMASYTLYTVKPTDSSFLLDEPQTTADAVFYLLISLCEKASHQRLIVAPICQYLETSTLQRNTLPRLQLSEPFLYYISKVLEVPTAVQIFTQLGGIQIICQNLVKLNKILINMQPGLISLIMQHMTKNTKLKLHSHSSANGNGKKSSSSVTTQTQRNQQDGLINFAPFCSISSENDTAQSADILIVNPVTSHRRPRTPAWSYMFYPNESHVDLTITLPTAILLKEIQLQPHSPTLASCPSAVALEISRDYGLGPIPFGPPLTTTGMTCIRLKLAKPEIATSVVLRLYRPKDSSNIGLTQIAILGNTIFSSNNSVLYGHGSTGSSSGNGLAYDQSIDDDSFTNTSIGWVRILARCYYMASVMSDAKLTTDVIGASAEYPGFLEACCSLMNIMPMIPNAPLQNLETVLLKLGAYSRELCLALIRTLLWGTTPQTYKLSNESICDLLFDLATSRHEFISDKIQVLLEWIVKLRQNFSNRSTRCTNPQSGFVKCVASILWSVHSRNHIPNLHDLITAEIFDACMYWIDALENDEPLKVAFDSLLCSLCCIKPELFNQLLGRLNVKLAQNKDFELHATGASSSSACGITDDNKGTTGTIWFRQFAAEKLETILRRPVYLSTLGLACQSPLAVYQLVDSGLLKLLAFALFEYCCSLSPEIERVSTGAAEPSTSSSSCLTDAAKAKNNENNAVGNSTYPPLLTIEHVPKILDFFSECCAEGHVRDWLGTQQGSIFWRPLLELLCNYRPMQLANEQMQQAFIRMERATIHFFARVTACHPKNQDNLTILLISVIKSPNCTTAASTSSSSKAIISGFTRQIVLQLLLENERILVSVRSKQPLQKKDTTTAFSGTVGTSSMALVNHHPSKRINAHHLLFYVSSSTKCQEILQNCVSEFKPIDGAASSASNISSSNNSEMKHDNSEKPSSSDPYGAISLNFNGLEHGMEFLSVAAGVTAKDKRIKDVKNQVAAIKDSKDIFPNFQKYFNIEDFLTPSNSSSITTCAQLVHPDCPDVVLTSDTTISQVLATLYSKGQSLSTPCITLNLTPVKNHNDDYDDSVVKAVNMEPLPSPLQRFSSRGGLSLLAQYLPTVYPDGAGGRKSPNSLPEKEKSPPMTDWVKLEPNDEIYEDLEDPITEPTSKHAAITSVPQHSLAAFGLFLRLPSYSDVLLRDKLRAQCLLRLVLGVTGDGEGNDIYSLSLAPSLPTLPFEVFRQLLDSSPLTTDDGMLLRRLVIEVGAMHLVLNCLSIFTHQSQNYQISSPQSELASGGIKAAGNNVDDSSLATSDDKSPMYWAKGTGFGTGSTAQSWNVEQALLRQKSEEEHVTVLLQVLSSYINPGDKIPSSMQSDEILTYHEISDVIGELPMQFLSLLQQSCLIPALSSYLRNDSVLDITRHIPLYRAILQLLRALSLSYQLVGLLQPQNASSSSPSISELLANMKTCVDTYAKRLKLNKKSNIKGQTQQVTVNIDDGDDEGLALLIPDIQETAILVQKATKADTLANQSRINPDGFNGSNIDRPPQIKSIEQRYLEVMKKLQFDTSEMIVESENNGFRFIISHHFEKMVRMAGDRYHPSRVKRLAQEAVTLSTSLPLSYSSSVFVRCDTDRLDIMKVLITGPADTPYANGCFEFDVFFPPDYPNLPMLINLETTGRHSVRFNPNLYNDGKVCLSVLNTWHGRPEEKWNAQTSSFLQVLVSIQSLILVPEPYFNEPGFERSRWSLSGMHSSREYNSNIYQACVRWAMLEQIRNPSPCFKDVIHTHFWLKRNEICTQIENWIEELSKPQFSERNSRTISFNSMVLRRQYRHLREELGKLKVPEGLEDLDMPFNPNVTLPVMTESATNIINTITQTANSCNIDNSSGSNTSASTQIPVKLTENAISDDPAKLDKLSVSTFNACLNLSSPASPPPSTTSSCSESAPPPIPMIIEVNSSSDFNDLSGSTTFLPPQPPVPPPVTATVTTVQSTGQQEDVDVDVEEADEDVEDVMKVDVNDFNYTEDEVQMLQALFFNDETYENSKLNDFIE